MSDTRTGPVVVATDLSEGADEAVRQASDWARRAGLALSVVHAVPNVLRLEPLFPQASVEAATQASALEARASEAVRARVQRLTDRTHFDVVVEPGSGHGVVIEVADRLNASLVVVGASGRGMVSRFLLGTTAEQVLRHARAPVLVARPSPSSSLVVAATDLSDRAIPSLRAAAAEARRRGARVLAVHCIETLHPAILSFEPELVLDESTLASIRSAGEETLRAQLARVDAAGDAVVVEGRAAPAILRVAQDVQAELVVASTHGHGGLARVALGSVTETLARQAPCSVLVVRTA